MEQIPYVRSVSMGIWVGNGSIHENQHNNGISHFIEHMLFKGTKQRTASDIAETFDRIGGDVNAFTSKEYTCYHAKIPDQHLHLSFEVLADMFFHSVFDEIELEKEKNVILEELHMYEDIPDDYIHDLIAEATYKNHALGYNIVGQEKAIRQISARQLHDYMLTHYTPENTVISVVGHFQNQDIIYLAEKYFQDFSSAYFNSMYPEPVVTYEHLAQHKNIEQSHLCIGLQGLNFGHKKRFPLILLNNVFGGSMSSRLFQQVREEQGLAYAVYSYHSSFQETGSLNVYAGTSNEHIEKVYDSCMRIMKELANNGITQKELHNTKEQLKGQLVLGLESTDNRMYSMSRNELMLRKHHTLDELVDRIDAITWEDVNELAAQLFCQEHSFALVSTFEEIPKHIDRYSLVV